MGDSPPPYEHVTQDKQSDKPLNLSSKGKVREPLSMPQSVPAMQAGPSYAPAGAPIQVYHYVNPNTGDSLTTPLPPNHPEMICLQQGRHVRRTKFGLLGVLAAVFWFPLGIGLCLLDRRVTCDRCGRTMEDGILCG